MLILLILVGWLLLAALLGAALGAAIRRTDSMPRRAGTSGAWGLAA
jgi:hypothetical protein